MAIARRTLDELERHLHKHAGLELPRWVVESRCAARMKELGLDEKAYVALFESKAGAAELAALVEVARVGETRFFRHASQVEAVVEVVIPSWRSRGLTSPRIWSAGCASGEEPYTLALVLARAFPPPGAPSILATDVSAEAIVNARRGVYSKATLDHVPEEWRSGLDATGSSVRVRSATKRLVTFEQSNLALGQQPTGFDLIWCRNVLIYFSKASRQGVLDRLVSSLRPSGFLFVGYSESLRDVPGLTGISWRDQVIYQKVDERTSLRLPTSKARGASNADASVTTTRKPPKAAPSVRPAPHPAPYKARPRATHVSAAHKASVVFHLGSADPAALSLEIGKVLQTPGLATLTVDLDAAEFVSDEVAPVLRRTCAAGRAQGIEVELRATRPGTQRWLRRHRLSGGDA